MKKFLIFSIASLAICTLMSCSDSDKEGGNVGNVTISGVHIKSGSIAGAKALAVAAKKTSSTRAAGDAEGESALYKLSDDGKFIDVSYTFNVEVQEGEEEDAKTVIQQIQSSLRISPNFIYSVGDFLWLANCFYFIPDFEKMEQGTVKHALNVIRDEYNESHHNSHGGHYLIRKNTGEIYTWETKDGAPFGMNDGYNPPSMLGRWFHAVGNKMYVREGGFNVKDEQGFHPGRVIRITDNGSSLAYNEVISASKNVISILPDAKNLGVICLDNRNYPEPYIFFTDTEEMVRLITPTETLEGEIHWSLVSVAGNLYAVRNYKRGDAEEGSNIVGFYKIIYNGNTASVGSLVAQTETSVDWNDDKFFTLGASTTANTFTFFAQNHLDGWRTVINTFDPAAGSIHSRNLPEHYNENSGFYIDGVACNEVTDQGFYVCDLSKDVAQYVNLDWSTASAWQSKVRSMKYVHFEAAFMAVKYDVETTDGQTIVAWVPITGENAGKVAILTDENGDPNFVINVLLSL